MDWLKMMSDGSQHLPRSRAVRRNVTRLLPCITLLTACAGLADVLELHNGIKVRGEVISQTDESITIRVKFGSRSREKSWPISKIRAVTVDGQRRVLGE